MSVIPTQVRVMVSKPSVMPSFKGCYFCFVFFLFDLVFLGQGLNSGLPVGQTYVLPLSYTLALALRPEFYMPLSLKETPPPQL